MPVFGPVRSRRLGLSLGVDLVPPKVCSMDCVYCEVGPTTHLTLERRPYLPFNKIKEALERALKEKAFEVITLTGSGEPTLNLHFPEVVSLVRELSAKPLAVLTNSTTLDIPEVCEALQKVDIVLASLDAVRLEAFRRVNRPLPEIRPETLIKGLKELREGMQGELWLEVLLVKGFNDGPQDLKALEEALREIGPHRVQLNTVVRPPADPRARPLSYPEMLALSQRLEAEILSAPPSPKRGPGRAPSAEDLLAYLSRRPAPVEELAAAFQVPSEDIERRLKELGGKITAYPFEGKLFYRVNPV